MFDTSQIVKIMLSIETEGHIIWIFFIMFSFELGRTLHFFRFFLPRACCITRGTFVMDSFSNTMSTRKRLSKDNSAIFTVIILVVYLMSLSFHYNTKWCYSYMITDTYTLFIMRYRHTTIIFVNVILFKPAFFITFVLVNPFFTSDEVKFLDCLLVIIKRNYFSAMQDLVVDGVWHFILFLKWRNVVYNLCFF